MSIELETSDVTSCSVHSAWGCAFRSKFCAVRRACFSNDVFLLHIFLIIHSYHMLFVSRIIIDVIPLTALESQAWHVAGCQQLSRRKRTDKYTLQPMIC